MATSSSSSDLVPYHPLYAEDDCDHQHLPGQKITYIYRIDENVREIVARDRQGNPIPMSMGIDKESNPTIFYHVLSHEGRPVRIVAFAKSTEARISFRADDGRDITLNKTQDVNLYIRADDPETTKYVVRNSLPEQESEADKKEPIISCFVWNHECKPLDTRTQPFYTVGGSSGPNSFFSV